MKWIGACALGRAAADVENRSLLRRRSCYNNSMGDAGAAALGEALKVNTALSTLVSVAGGMKSVAGGRGVAVGVLTLPDPLRRLEGISLEGGGVPALSDGLKTNSALTQLSYVLLGKGGEGGMNAERSRCATA